MSGIEERIFNAGLVPVIKLEDAGDAIPLAGALKSGGLDVLEITFRTDAAELSISNVTKAYPDLLVGAGTVSDADTAKIAMDAGAAFIVSPGFNPTVAEFCAINNVLYIPGVSVPTDIEAALAVGLKLLKFFPAEAGGGVDTLLALAAPYPGVRFLPTGGINAGNLERYLTLDSVVACGGSWVAGEKLIKEKAFTEITRLAREAVTVVHGFKFGHVGINTESEAAAGAISDTLTRLFGFPQRDIGVAIFSTDSIEVMKGASPGVYGHLAIKTNNLKRAMAYMEKLGVSLNYESISVRNGKPYLIYLKDPIGPYAVHISS